MLLCYRNFGPHRIQPLSNFTGYRVQFNPLTTKCPAVIGYRNKKACRQTVHSSNFTAKQSNFTAKSHRPNAKLISRFQNILFQAVQFRYRVHIIYLAEQLLLRQLISCSPVPTDAYAEESCAAALALRLIYSMKNTFANSVQISTRTS
ncbi:hypothetical protein D3C76_1315070 [compost metagenome]